MKNLLKCSFIAFLLLGTVSCEDEIEKPDPVINPVAGGTLTLVGDPISFIANDNVEDKIAGDKIVLSGNIGNASQWIVTDGDNKILGLPKKEDEDEEEAFTKVDFDGAGAGDCFIWHLSSNGPVGGLEVGKNVSDLNGIFELSGNSITVTRILGDDSVLGGTLTGGPFKFEVQDGVEDKIGADEITLAGELGESGQWVVTDAEANILGLPPTFSDVNFDETDLGNCLIWYLSFRGTLEGAEVGKNASDIEGNFALSNAIEVERVAGDDTVKGGTIEGGPFEFVIDGTDDNLAEEDIMLSENIGDSQWVVTDSNGLILGLPASFTDVNFDTTEAGTCLIWHLSSYGVVEGAAVGNFAKDLKGIYELSNSIEVVRRTKNIVELASENPDFSSLVTALTREDLTTDFVALLSGEGPFTVFAPNNAAFSSLLTALEVATIEEIPVETLEAALTYHVIDGAKVTSGMLPTSAVTVGGAITIDPANAIITDAAGNQSNIIATDIEASNGIIHVIDTVLLP